MNSLDSKVYLKNLCEVADREFDYRKPLSSGDWENWQVEFRPRLSELLGLNRIKKKFAGLQLYPRIVEIKHFTDYTREKICITTEPGIEISFYLLLPKFTGGPLPLVVTTHGHEKRGKEMCVGNYETKAEKVAYEAGDGDIAFQAVEQGYAVIAPDIRGIWEMACDDDLDAGKNNSCEELQRKALMFGRTLIGERVWDIGRLLDYAAMRNELDTNRIIITGNSGGGTVSLFAAACDKRISIAVPGSYFCTYEASILKIPHCICNIVPGLMQLGEMYDVAGLIAPRPLLLVNGAKDDIYPIEGTYEAFAHLKRIYESMGTPDRCKLSIGDGGHRYYKADVWTFIQKYLGK